MSKRVPDRIQGAGEGTRYVTLRFKRHFCWLLGHQYFPYDGLHKDDPLRCINCFKFKDEDK